MKQPILRFSVKPVAFHDVTKPAGIHPPQRQGNGEEESGNGEEERGNGGNEGEENRGNGETGVETKHVTETKDDWMHDEDVNALIRQLGMADPRDSSDPSDSLDAKSSKKAPNSGKQSKPKDKKKGKPSKPSKPSKRGARSSKSEDDSEEWGKPWKRKRVGGSARSRRMVSNNQTGQSAYMCL